jgi:DNA topoisomerase-3
MRLFLCEKPSQGKDIARVLGVRQRGSGCYNGASIVVTSLLEAALPEAAVRWVRMEALNFFCD